LLKTPISISRGTWKYPFTAEGPDEDNHSKVQQRDLMKTLNQQRDLMKTFIPSSVEGPEKDNNSIQQRDLIKTVISISRGT
jgi:hypothetical protein